MSQNTDSADKGTEEKAISEGSDKAANQKGSSEQEHVSVAEFNKLQNTIESLRRSLQSDKDKGVKKVNERVSALEGDLRTVLQSAMKEGRSIGDVLDAIEQEEERSTRQTLKEMAEAFRTGAFPKSLHGSEDQAGVDVSSVVDELELDKNDLRVKDFMSKEFATEKEAMREGAKLLKTILKTQPSDADEPSTVARRQPNLSEQERLNAEFQEGAKNLRGQALINFKMKMREKGWNGS
ncbi:MAG TPA: hypothetical protein VIY48_09845 [Candidatus Paceibacterota bacterium]